MGVPCACDGVDGLQWRLHVAGVGQQAPFPLLQLGVVEAVGREVQRVAGAGEVAVIIHRADRNVQQTW